MARVQLNRALSEPTRLDLSPGAPFYAGIHWSAFPPGAPAGELPPGPWPPRMTWCGISLGHPSMHSTHKRLYEGGCPHLRSPDWGRVQRDTLHHVGKEAADPTVRPPDVGEEPTQRRRRLLYPRGQLLEVGNKAPSAIQGEAQIFHGGPHRDGHTGDQDAHISWEGGAIGGHRNTSPPFSGASLLVPVPRCGSRPWQAPLLSSKGPPSSHPRLLLRRYRPRSRILRNWREGQPA